MKLAITNDHGGTALKHALKTAFPDVQWLDLGVQDESRVDYPSYAKELAERMKKGEIDKAIAICGSGVGICMALNRYPHIRAANVMDTVITKLCREHNDANVLCFGGRLIGPDIAKECVKVFLETEFLGGRYAERLEMMKSCC